MVGEDQRQKAHYLLFSLLFRLKASRNKKLLKEERQSRKTVEGAMGFGDIRARTISGHILTPADVGWITRVLEYENSRIRSQLQLHEQFLGTVTGLEESLWIMMNWAQTIAIGMTKREVKQDKFSEVKDSSLQGFKGAGTFKGNGGECKPLCNSHCVKRCFVRFT